MKPLRLDLNEGARPPRELFAELDRSSLLRLYPDRSGLEARLADRFGIESGRVVVTGGGDDALDRCCRAFLAPGRPALLARPGFGTMDRLAEAAGGELLAVDWPGGEDFPLDAFLRKLEEGPGMVFLISPNNPTGDVVAPEVLRRLAGAAAEREIVVVLDQVYAEYSNDGGRVLTGVALELPNVVLVRTFSKAWGMAGCRVGYLMAEPKLADGLRGIGNPYPVASPSLALVEAQLRRGDQALHEHVAQVQQERRELGRWLRLRGMSVPESQANFLLVQAGRRVGLLARGLESQGIRVRSFRRPELAGAVRITLPGDPDDFERLLGALAVVLEPEALLLDLDGVLADVRESYDAAIRVTAAELGVEVDQAQIVAERQRGDANNDWVLTRRLLARRGREVSLEEVTRRFQRHYLGAPGEPGLRELERPLVDGRLLERWSQRRRLAIVTGRPRKEAEHFLEAHGWSRWISALVTLDDGPPKPDPFPVRHALQLLGVERAWFLGDTPDDVRAARASGVLPIGVVAPEGIDSETLLKTGAVEALASAAEVEELLP